MSGMTGAPELGGIRGRDADAEVRLEPLLELRLGQHAAGEVHELAGGVVERRDGQPLGAERRPQLRGRVAADVLGQGEAGAGEVEPACHRGPVAGVGGVHARRRRPCRRWPWRPGRSPAAPRCSRRTTRRRSSRRRACPGEVREADRRVVEQAGKPEGVLGGAVCRAAGVRLRAAFPRWSTPPTATTPKTTTSIVLSRGDPRLALPFLARLGGLLLGLPGLYLLGAGHASGRCHGGAFRLSRARAGHRGRCWTGRTGWRW